MCFVSLAVRNGEVVVERSRFIFGHVASEQARLDVFWDEQGQSTPLRRPGDGD
jgi:hypothetical protein